MLASPAKKVNKSFAAARTGIGSIDSSCGNPLKNDLLAQVEVGNGQRYCLTAPAVFHYAGDIIAGGFVVAVHGLHQELLIGKIGNILLYTLDDLGGGQQSLLGQPHNTGLIVGTPVFFGIILAPVE